MVRIPLAAAYGSLPSEPVIGAKQGNDGKWPVRAVHVVNSNGR